MDFSLNDEHLALRDAVQRFCEGEYPAAQRGNPSPAEQTKRRRTALAELGVLGLPFSTALGGSEQGAVETMLVAQELGRALADWSFVGSTVMACELLTRLGTAEQQQRWGAPLARGECSAAVALYEENARYQWQHCAARAQADAKGWVLNGRKAMLLGGDSAQTLLVLARTADPSDAPAEFGVFALDASAPGVELHGFDTLDNRRAAHLVLHNVRLHTEQRLGTAAQTAPAIDAMLDAANAALCAEAVGAVEALLAHTADHLRTRKQFGAPLAKFQVLQHRVADIAIALEQLKSMACAAAMAVQAGHPGQRRRLVSAAKVLASQQGRAIGLAAIQLHGAMGMTDECRVSHYAKRLLVIGQLFGDAAWHLQALRSIEEAAPEVATV